MLGIGGGKRTPTLVKRLLQDRRGSYTIEAALVLPVVLLLSVLLMLAAVYYFLNVWNYYTAVNAADRMAHTWDNSYKHPVTGMYSPYQHDPLYWRLLYDGAEDWFAFGLSSRAESVEFPSPPAGSSSLVAEKLRKGANGLPETMYGKASYSNRGWMKSVTVETAQPFRVPSVLGIRFGDASGGSSEETIVDAAEFIRNIDLVRTYLSLLGETWGQGELQDVLKPWIDTAGGVGDGRRLEFALHAEAVRYLRSLVRGREDRIDTLETGDWRLIDAMDGQEIAHQAYLGAKSLNADMRFQLMKDVELLDRGEVKGVVWHFFRRTGSEIYGPNAALRSELAKYGIAIVVHP